MAYEQRPVVQSVLVCDICGGPIEENTYSGGRDHRAQVTHVGSVQLAPEGAKVRNPSFDVTPSKYITAIITERGIFKAPFTDTLGRG